MKSFKQFFYESVESEADLPPPPAPFGVPPPRAKFQRGDVVMVQNPQPHDKDYFKRQLPKYMQGYTNAIGRIVGHRTIGVDTQFAVEFEDKTIGKMKGYFLVGPFRSIQSAKKYQGREKLLSTDIAAEDHKRFAEAQKEVATDEEIENAFKTIFVQKEGFEWLEKPISFVVDRFKVIVLATKKVQALDNIWYAISDEIPPDLEKSMIFFKLIDPATNKFAKTASFFDEGGAASYGLVTPVHRTFSHPTFKDGKLIDAGIYYRKKAIRSPKTLKLLYQQFQSVKYVQSIEDGMEYFDFVNKVETKGNLKIIPEREESYTSSIIPAEVTTNVNAFKNYIFKGNVSISCVVDGRLTFPKTVEGKEFNICSSEPIKNLEGFPVVPENSKIIIDAEQLMSFEGLPQVLNHSLVIKDVPSLNKFPKVINGDCEVYSIKSFAGGKDTKINGTLFVDKSPESYKEIPLADHYDFFYDKSEEEVAKIEKYVKQRVIIDRELSKEFDMSALEDF